MTDHRGRPVALALTPGNVADVGMAVPQLDAVAPPKRLIADKACDADSLRRRPASRNVQGVIPSNATRTVPHPLDRAACALRDLIKRLIGRPKNWRRIATRYARSARNYLAALALAAAERAK